MEMSLYLKEFLLIWIVFMTGALSPGPDALLVVRNSMCYGRKMALYTALGAASSVTIHCLYILFGLGIVFINVPILQLVVKYVGCLYLLIIGIRSLFFTDKTPLIQEGEKTARHHFLSGKSAFRIGFFTNLLNVYAIVYLISLLTLEISPGTPGGLRVLYSVILGAMYGLWLGIIGYLLTHRRLVRHMNAFSHWIARLAGVFLIYLAVDFFLGSLGEGALL